MKTDTGRKALKHTKKYLELENKWLWYNHTDIDGRAKSIIVEQYDRKGAIIAKSVSALPPKKHWPKHPKELGINK